MKFNIIGAGRLGKNLALSLLHSGNGQLVALCNRRLQSAMTAVTEVGAGLAIADVAALPEVQLTFITAPDDYTASIALSLAAAGSLSPGSMVVHCSGVLGSDVLKPLQDSGCLTASIHPLRAFRAHHLNSNAFQDCDCVVEGDDDAVLWLTRCFSQMGARVVSIDITQKSVYHAAAVMASNYVVTLAGSAVALMLDAGLTEQQAQPMVLRMMSSSLANLQQTTHASQALTGPLMRGDLNTINKHLQAIKSSHIGALYRAAGLATLPLTGLDEGILSALSDKLEAIPSVKAY